MDQEIFVDVEFVVVETESAAPLVCRPAPKPARWSWEDTGLTVERAHVMLAELLRCPVRDVRIMDRAGRAYLVEYEPLGKADPDIVLLDWPSARPVQRLILGLQEARALNVREWGEWWQIIDGYVRDLEKLTAGVKISGDERSFVLRWARYVRDSAMAIGATPLYHADGW